MSRTFLIDGVQKFNSNAHDHQTALERALVAGGVVDNNGVPVTKFMFDALAFARGFKTEQLRSRSLNSLAFMSDAYIQGALSKILGDFYRHAKAENGSISYQEFLDHITGLEASYTSLDAMGLEITDVVASVRKLLTFRAEVHAAIAGELRDPSAYVTPDLSEKIANPVIRRVSAKSEAGYAELAKEDATDDNGVVDVELMNETLEMYKAYARTQRQETFNFEKMRAGSLITILSCIKADVFDHTDADADDGTFLDLTPRHQLGMMTNLRNSLNEARLRTVDDNRLSIPEKAALRLEVKAEIKKIEAAMTHSVFDDLA